MLQPGMAGLPIGSMACPAGEKIGLVAASVDGTYLDYFQDWNDPAIGFYVSVC